MPLWAAVVIGLGSGVISGLGGTLMTIGHERRAEFRTRQLTAAEDYLRTSLDCIAPMRAAREALEADRFNARIIEDVFKQLYASRELMLREFFRIQLLFGESRTRQKSIDVHEGLNNVIKELERWRDKGERIDGKIVPPEDLDEQLKQAIESWTNDVNRFGFLARLDVSQTFVGRTLWAIFELTDREPRSEPPPGTSSSSYG